MGEQYSSMPSESDESESESDNGQSPTESESDKSETAYSSMVSTQSNQSSYEDTQSSQSSYVNLRATQDTRPDRFRLNVYECQHLVQKNPRVKKLLQCGHKFKAAKEFYRWDKRARHECPKCHNVLSGENIKKVGHTSIL